MTTFLLRGASAIQRMPPEVLGEIFAFSLPAGRWIEPKIDEAPLLLCRVCRRWRNIAISTPSLWSSISITVAEHHSKPQLPLIQTWLSRSGHRPLSFSIYAPANAEIAGAILEVYMPHIARWSAVALELLNSESMPRIPYGGAVALDTLDIQFGDIFSSLIYVAEVGGQLTNLFGRAPPIRDMIIRGHPALWNYLIAVEWQRLEELEVESELSLSQYIHLLRRCPHLVECTFHVGDSTGSPLPPHNMITPHLRHIEILSYSSLASLFDILTLPALESIILRFPTVPIEEAPTWCQGPFIACLQRSACKLTHFTLKSARISDADFLECLRHMPLLETLTVVAYGRETIITDHVVRALTYSDEGVPQGICPRLSGIIFGSFSVGTTDGLIGDMVESRWVEDGPEGVDTIPACLTNVHVCLPESHEADIRCLKALEREGLSLLIDSNTVEQGP
ncbi:hypothetical protein PLICRDRAFT_365336 [Plicaturopsis crispa FD-325 SS-3]|uniref:F-box domain-containing protein n=1 Tax=Plicaturopsis crispa FD-325 SS-3 TaxID=944288 RepID=A0A0C9SR75_PLICR|nr:hypothetical protein PLICRDRAFT_365336 [Plicaturopsis crispa FD-325 SS-3]